MRPLTALIALTFLASLTACDGQNPAALGTPVSLQLPGGEIAGPRLSERLDGGLVLSWIEPAESDAVLRYAAISDGELATPVDVVADRRMFVNWADLPSVMQVSGEHWIAHWLRYSAERTYSYNVVLSQSFDDGKNWSEPMPAHTDGTPTEHGFVSMHRQPEGVGLVWLDGRNTPAAPMTLRGAVVTPDGKRTHEQVIDPSVCDCCQTDIAVSSRGPMAVYRDRTDTEIRDIYVTRYTDETWETGSRLFADNWEIAGCPVNGPSIVADGERVAIAWFSAAGNAPVVRVMLSQDGGTTFGAPVEVAARRLAGYVGLSFIDADGFAVSWVERHAAGNRLMVRTLSQNGSPGPVRQVADIEQVRVFPQLGFQGGRLYLFWTDTAGEVSTLRGAAIPVLE